MVVIICSPSLVELKLTDLPKSGGAMAHMCGTPGSPGSTAGSYKADCNTMQCNALTHSASPSNCIAAP